MNYYRCMLKTRQVHPYIAVAIARNKTAAANMFLKHIKGYRLARKSVGAVRVDEVTEKAAKGYGQKILGDK